MENDDWKNELNSEFDKEISDSEFMSQLIRENYDILMGYTYRITKSKAIAETLVQDTFYEALKKRTLLEKHPNSKDWLLETIINKLRAFNEKGSLNVITWECIWKR